MEADGAVGVVGRHVDVIAPNVGVKTVTGIRPNTTDRTQQA